MNDRKALNPCFTLGEPLERPPGVVVVLGVARGGTTMVAGVLRILGIDLGSNITADDNEDPTFLLHRGDRRIFKDREFSEQRVQYIQHVKRHIVERNSSGKTWGWKDPLASYYIQDVLTYLPNPAFIFVSRDPIAVTISERAAGRPRVPGVELAQIVNASVEYQNIAYFLARTSMPSLLISYERALRYPGQIVTSIRDFLCCQPNPDCEARAAHFIRPDCGSVPIQELLADRETLA